MTTMTKAQLASRGGVGSGSILQNMEAAQWLWSILWSENQSSFVKLRLLETIQLNGKGGISGWLFTSLTDGTVKSRSKGRWNPPGVVDKCLDEGAASKQPSPVLRVHSGLGSGSTVITWNCVKSGETASLVSTPGEADVLLCFAHIEGSVSFAEVVYEMNVPVAKVTTHSLYQGNNLAEQQQQQHHHHHNLQQKQHALPPKKLVCLNKLVCRSIRDYMVDMVRVLESRGKQKIARLVCVLLLESAEDESKLPHLHHCKEVVFMSSSTLIARPGGAGKAGGGGEEDDEEELERQERMEKRSATCSEVTSASSSGNTRHSKCTGDFCQYDGAGDDGGELGIGGGKSGGRFVDDDMDGLGDVRAEAKRALRRHRREENEGAGGEEDELLAAASAEREQTLAAATEDASGVQKKLARKVPFKSIALARQDMLMMEEKQTTMYDHLSMPWPEALFHWFWRLGRSHMHKGGAGVPVSGAHSIGASLLGVTAGPAAGGGDGFRPFADLGKPSKKDQGSGVGGGGVGLSTLKEEGESSHGGGGSSSSEILYDLPGENAYTGHTRRTIGQVSWYYSEARVCDRCYCVYKDIDRRRDRLQLKLFRAQRKAAAENEEQAGREIEKRIFEQRKFVSRISAAPLRAENQRSPIRGGGGRGGIVGAPKGALPPLPWQLRDEQRAKEYESGSFSSSFIRNIRGKAQDMAAMMKQDRDMEKAKRRAHKLGGLLEGGDGDSTVFAEQSLDPDFDWHSVTGGRGNNAQKAKAARKVIGGLGENRPQPKSIDFDPKRLLHPWQRDMERMRKKAEGTYIEEEEEEYTGYAPLSEKGRTRDKIAKTKKSNKSLQQQQQGKDYRKVTSAGVDDAMMMGGGKNLYPLNGGASLNGGGSMVSQLTMEPSMLMMSLNNNNNNNNGNNSNALRGGPSLSSLDGLDDDEWIKSLMGQPKGSSVKFMSNASVASGTSVRSNASGGGGGKRTVSFSADDTALPMSNSPKKQQQQVASSSSSPSKQAMIRAGGGDDEGEDDDDDEAGIGCSPFVIPLSGQSMR